VGVHLVVGAALFLAGCGSAGDRTDGERPKEERATRLVDRPEDCEGGGFLAVSAFRDVRPRAVLAAAAQHLRQEGVAAELREKSTCEALDGRAYSARNGWTVVVWPPYFNVYDVELATAVSRRLGVLAATVHEYDGDYWTHVTIEGGRVLDRFASRPAYFAENPGEAARLRREWRGDAAAVAAAFGVPAGVIHPYLVEVDERQPDRKVFADDEFELTSIWVFTDFWERLGIRYPDDVDDHEAVLRVEAGFLDELQPTSEL
jgi:hypothetical protein